MTNKYIDGLRQGQSPSAPPEERDGILDWEPNGRGGSYMLPARSDNATFKVRMNARPFLPQSSKDNSGGVLKTNVEGNKAWRKPVVLYAGRIPESGELELTVNIEHYTEICVGHVYDDFLEINPWYSLLPLRKDGETTRPTAAYTDGGTGTQEYAEPDGGADPQGSDTDGNGRANRTKTRIAVVAPGVAMVQRDAGNLNETVSETPDYTNSFPNSSSYQFDTTPTDSAYVLNFRGELAQTSRSYPNPNYPQDSSPTRSRTIYWRKTGNDLGQGFGTDNVRYIVVR